MNEFLNFNINGVDLGKIVYDQYIRYSGIGTTNIFSRIFYANLAKSFFSSSSNGKIFQKI